MDLVKLLDEELIRHTTSAAVIDKLLADICKIAKSAINEKYASKYNISTGIHTYTTTQYGGHEYNLFHVYCESDRQFQPLFYVEMQKIRVEVYFYRRGYEKFPRAKRESIEKGMELTRENHYRWWQNNYKDQPIISRSYQLSVEEVISGKFALSFK